jgi:hypothetical protein
MLADSSSLMSIMRVSRDGDLRPKLLTKHEARRIAVDIAKLPAEAVSSAHARVSELSQHWLKIKNPAAPAVKRETEEAWGKKRRSRWQWPDGQSTMKKASTVCRGQS